MLVPQKWTLRFVKVRSCVEALVTRLLNNFATREKIFWIDLQ